MTVTVNGKSSVVEWITVVHAVAAYVSCLIYRMNNCRKLGRHFEVRYRQFVTIDVEDVCQSSAQDKNDNLTQINV